MQGLEGLVVSELLLLPPSIIRLPDSCKKKFLKCSSPTICRFARDWNRGGTPTPQFRIAARISRIFLSHFHNAIKECIFQSAQFP